MNEINWSPWDDISLNEKIRRTKNAIQEFQRYNGPIALAMVANKKQLLSELEKLRPAECR